MPTVDADGVTLRYAVAGAGETVVFVNDVGFGAWLWSYVQPAVAGPYVSVVWELRGTGESTAPPRPYGLSALVGDLASVVRAVEARRIHLVGLGLGGAIALEYACDHDHVASLTLLGTAGGKAVDEEALSSLSASRDDPAALRTSLRMGFAPGVIEAHPAEIDRIVEWRARDDADPQGWAAQRAAWLAARLPDLYEITTPALVMSARNDRVVDPAASGRLADELPRGTHRQIEGGHLLPVSESQVVTDELLAWLEAHTA